MTRRTKYAFIVLFTVAVIVAASSLYLSSREIAENNHKWCATLHTLLSHRPPSGAAVSNPSRAYEQNLYGDFDTLRGQFGCG